jgi:hypothetical protein
MAQLAMVMNALAGTGHDGEDLDNLFGAIDALRIPVGYLAELFTAGDPEPVRQVLRTLFGAVLASRLAEAGHEDAELWGAAMKAHGIDTANQATAELALLVGAAGIRADCQIAKTRRDLNGLLYADGIHDSLYRAAGKHHTAGESTAVPAPRSRPASVPMTA